MLKSLNKLDYYLFCKYICLIYLFLSFTIYLIINANGIQIESNSTIAANYLWVNVFQSI